MQRIKQGDTVEVIAGKDVGERGKVVAVRNKDNRVVVEGVQAQIIEFEGPIHMSNVMLVCTQCGKSTRVGFRVRDDGFKTRVCRKCGADID
jgi:large subunit ribosomal protein L24